MLDAGITVLAGAYPCPTSSLQESCSNSTLPQSETSPTSGFNSLGPIPQSTPSQAHHENIIDEASYLALGCICTEDPSRVESNGFPASLQSYHFQNIPDAPGRSFAGFNYEGLSKLLQEKWIRMETARSSLSDRFVIYRIYVLPHDRGLARVNRTDRRLSNALESLLGAVDISQETWNGRYLPGNESRFDMWATKDDGSLYYMFNTISSPAPNAKTVKEKYKREALEDILDNSNAVAGLKTELYPFQRRSAGLMLQREACSTLELDPRLEAREAPDGTLFYYGPWDMLFMKDPHFYSSCRGGILAETMGLGKTLICLSMILATKHHPPEIPANLVQTRERSGVATLADLAIATANRASIPWRVEFERIRLANGLEFAEIKKRLLENPPRYEIPSIPMRWNRNTILAPPQVVTTASTTIIVVPRNLCRQWQSEIEKHVEPGALNVLIMDDNRKALPSPDVLRTYDIILFSRTRFESEHKHGADSEGRRLAQNRRECRCPYIGSSRVRACTCLREDMIYVSPLKCLHFKRIIVDEGHFFSNSSTVAVSVASSLVIADHRWVISGTPAKDLLGVEMDLSIAGNGSTPSDFDSALDQRKAFSIQEDTRGAVESLCSLAGSFLQIEPWAAPEKAKWKDYIYRHEAFRYHTFSGFSKCMRRMLASMVIKTKPDDIKDLRLPPLYHQVVKLEPSFFDRLSANLFTMVLTANAVTSERSDSDYLFHKDSVKARYQLIANLRQSAFCWTGFSEGDVNAGIENSERYLSKEDTSCSQEDRELLANAIECGKKILQSRGWQCLSRSHELGIFFEDWPEDKAQYWSFYDKPSTVLLTGISQALSAQKFIHERVCVDDPNAGFSGAGIKALAPIRVTKIVKEHAATSNNTRGPTHFVKAGVPTSSLYGEPKLSRRPPLGIKHHSPKRSPKSKESKTPQSDHSPNKARISSSMSAYISDPRKEAEWKNTNIIGTTSAKMSYLISQILKYYREEKILVFYQGDNAAYYIAQVLDLMHIEHEIYARSLTAAKKAEYVVRFNEQRSVRVLLMDVQHAAFGLNLSSASRIYFVNPVCRPNIEAQAIKRAHRIGQRREVHVETLVLEGTIEEKMLERSKSMTRGEHMEAKVLEDDGGVRAIIQSATLLPIDDSDISVPSRQMAPLQTPQQLWFRPGWRDATYMRQDAGIGGEQRKPVSISNASTPDNNKRFACTEIVGGSSISTPLATNRKRVRLVAEQEGEASDDNDDDDEPLVNCWTRRSTWPPTLTPLTAAQRS